MNVLDSGLFTTKPPHYEQQMADKSAVRNYSVTATEWGDYERYGIWK